MSREVEFRAPNGRDYVANLCANNNAEHVVLTVRLKNNTPLDGFDAKIVRDLNDILQEQLEAVGIDSDFIGKANSLQKPTTLEFYLIGEEKVTCEPINNNILYQKLIPLFNELAKTDITLDALREKIIQMQATNPCANEPDALAHDVTVEKAKPLNASVFTQALSCLTIEGLKNHIASEVAYAINQEFPTGSTANPAIYSTPQDPMFMKIDDIVAKAKFIDEKQPPPVVHRVPEEMRRYLTGELFDAAQAHFYPERYRASRAYV